MTPEKRTRLLLLIFLGLLVANAYRYMGGDLDSPIFMDSESPQASDRANYAQTEVRNLPELSFHFQAHEKKAGHGPSRNPFTFGIDRREEARQAARFQEIEQERAELTSAEPTPEAEPPPETPSFDGKVLGIIQSVPNGESKLAVNFDQELFLLQVGDIVGQRYRLARIARDSVEFVRLSDQASIQVQLEPATE